MSASAGGFELYIDAFNKAFFSGSTFGFVYERFAWLALTLAIQGNNSPGFYRTGSIGGIFNIVVVLLLASRLGIGDLAVPPINTDVEGNIGS